MAQSLAERRIQGPDIPCDDSHRSEDDREIPADFFNFKEFFYFACQYIKIGSIIVPLKIMKTVIVIWIAGE